MDLGFNYSEPLVMHVDLNSCFATIEQQANPLLRGKPIAVAAYDSPRGCILAPSIEAKRLGIGVGMRVYEGKAICKDLVILEPDPCKYRDAHIKLRHILQSYSPSVSPKSIDEAVIDFKGVYLANKSLVEIGQEIKSRIRSDIGEWVCCNIGISTNRFLAKLAASLHKPDGLDVITCSNLSRVYSQVKLTDLHGINRRFEVRLKAEGIFNPLDFLNASYQMLRYQAFKSICGYYWFVRLRGWEVDAVDFSRKSFGNDYALGEKTADPKKLARLLMKLCEKTGRRLRALGYTAKGIHVACAYQNGGFWHQSKTFCTDMYATAEIYRRAQHVFDLRSDKGVVIKLSVSCFGLMPTQTAQLELFDTSAQKLRRLSGALDRINDSYGEFTIMPARMLGMNRIILDRIAFGGVKDLEKL